MSKLDYIGPFACFAALASGTVAGHTLRPAAAPVVVAPNGASLYAARCGGCHSITTNRVGPAHRGVVGRRAGSAPGYAYSAPLRAANIVWTPQNLDRWLQGPQAVVPGSRMVTRVADPAERAAVIAYLGTQRN